jgi:hypothetical protein
LEATIFIENRMLTNMLVFVSTFRKWILNF